MVVIIYYFVLNLQMNYKLIVFIIIFIIITLSVSVYTVTYEIENKDLTYDTKTKNETDIIIIWVLIALMVSFIIFLIILTILYYNIRGKPEFEKYKYYNNEKIQMTPGLIFGLFSIVSSLISWDYAGRNSLYPQKEIFFFLTILSIILIFVLKL